MCEAKIIRLLRLKHKLTTTELSESIGVSQSRYSRIELEDITATEHLNKLLNHGFERLIQSRIDSICELQADYLKYKSKLLYYLGNGDESI